NVGDALVCLRFALGLETPTQEDTAHGDVAPLDINGQPDPDGNITVGDALVILRKALGLVSWTLAPTTGELIKSQTIGAEGGTIILDDFSLTIPSGVFDSDVKLELYDLTGSLPFDEDIVTKTFRLKGLPDDYTQPLIPDIKYSGTLSDESFIVVGAEVFIPSLSTTDMAYHLFPAADSSNFLTYSPVGGSRSLKSSDYTSRSNSSRNFLDFFGITGWSTYKANENLRSNGAPGHFIINYPTWWVSRSDLDPLFQYLEEAYTTYENMGFSYGGRTKWPVEVNVMHLASDTYGHFCLAFLGNNYVTLEFNMFKLGNLSELRRTAGHEFFHLIQYLYDSRDKISRNSKRNARTISIQWLNEATAVWAEEKFTNIPNYVSPIRDGHEMAPFDGMEAGSGGNIVQSGGHGYGMSAFIKYLVSKYGESILRDIYLQILEQKHPVEAINQSLRVNDDLFFMWEHFLREYVTGNIYNVQKARFTAIISGLFRIQSDTDRSKTFTENYPDLSAKLFRIRLDYPEIDKDASINLKTNQGYITAFKIKDQIQYLDHSMKNLTIPDIRKLTDEGYDLLVMVTNSNYSSPYTNSKAIKLDIAVSLPGTVTVRAASDKIVADGTTSTLITAVVKDVDGNNIADGTKVEFTTTGGTLSAANATTINGEATVTLTSPTTIGTADITATVGKVSGSTKVDFIAGPIDKLTLTANPNTLPADGTSTSTIQVTAKDINGNPVADESIGLTVSSGSLSAASAKTDSIGVASVIYTTPGSAPSGGTSTITATTTNAVTATIVITINSAPSWQGWPGPQWCPKTGPISELGPNLVLDYPGGNPDRVNCSYYYWVANQIESEVPMKNGLFHGIYKYYFESGQLKLDIPYEDGEYNGIYKRYFESGQIMSEYPYVDGSPNGTHKQYFANGQLRYKWPYVDGVLNGTYKSYYESGQLMRETPYVDGKENGTERCYNEDGKLTTCNIYENGNWLGFCN
ncbi:MAG: invasin domain 3-containing protein, partial [Thermodesulfobacteriota bacterium]|nr:invasin domain 3-containing protein [Thermodesulfobacteriota bacterium]